MRRRTCVLLLFAVMMSSSPARAGQPAFVEHTVAIPDFMPQVLVVAEQTERTFVAGSRQDPAGRLVETLAVLDSRTGRLLRTVDTSLLGVGAQCCQMWALVDGPTGTIIAGGQGGTTLYVLDARSGDVLATAHDSTGATILPGHPAGRVLSLVETGRFSGVHVLDGRSGRTIAALRCPANIAYGFQRWAARLAVDGPLGRVFVPAAGAGGPGICVFDLLHNRAGFISVAVGSAYQIIDAMALDQRTAHLFVASDGATGGEVSSMLTLLDARTAQVRSRTAIAPYPSQVLLEPNRLFILCGDYPDLGTLDMVDTATGRLILARSNRAEVYSLTTDPLTGDVVIKYGDGSEDRLDARTGAVRVRVDAQHVPTRIAVDRATHRAYAISPGPFGQRGQPGFLRVRDTRTGALLRSVALLPLFPLYASGEPMVVDTDLHRGFLPVVCPAETTNPRSGTYIGSSGPPRSQPIPGSSGCIMVLDTAR